MFGPPVLGVLAQLNESITHQRPERMGQRRQLDGEPCGQVLQRRSLLIGARELGYFCDERELCGFEVQRRQCFVIQLAKPACREAECSVRADPSTQKVLLLSQRGEAVLRINELFGSSHTLKMVEYHTIGKGRLIDPTFEPSIYLVEYSILFESHQ